MSRCARSSDPIRRRALRLMLGAWVAVAIGGAGGAETPSAPPGPGQVLSLTGCRTPHATIRFDFEGASRSSCFVAGERAFEILVTPEHAPPINPSPWYAFRYESVAGEPLEVVVRYSGARHRYAPRWQGSGEAGRFASVVGDDGASIRMALPPGGGIVSAQELLTSAHYDAWISRLVEDRHARPIRLGRSHDGRPIEAVRLGRADAPDLVVLLGRQHPPEVTGAMAMEAFVDRLAVMLTQNAGLGERYQFLVVPLLNPDGVARGHWRANLGGQDINRDWGLFTQPETRAVKRWLDDLPAGVRPAAMIDFHSTRRNLFYVQGEEADQPQLEFRRAWLEGKENLLHGYPFTIEPRDANPGSGTAKNWFHAAYGIPAYTYEVADDADRQAIRTAAEALATALPAALDELTGAR